MNQPTLPGSEVRTRTRGDGSDARALGAVLGAGRRAIGALLVLLVILPVYRLLAGRETGLAGTATVALADDAFGLLWSGFAVVLIPAVLCMRILDPAAFDRRLAAAERAAGALDTGRFALGFAILAATLTVLFTLLVVDGKPNHIDAMSQLVHARYVAAGVMAGPVSPFGAFWHIQNTIVTPAGWVSHYPPGHVVLLAIGLRLGAVWLVGGALVAVTVFFTVLAADRLFPDRPLISRAAGALLALNPFLIGLAGVYMNHVTAAAFTAAGAYFALRARDGHRLWAIPAGAAFGMAFAARPLSGLVVASVLTVGIWCLDRHSRPDWVRFFGARMALAFLGSIPPGFAVAAHNAHYFGNPFRFGYDVALGKAVRLGFHRDPWGNLYGPIEAIAYTSSDLVGLSLRLLESPLPVVVLAGAFLLSARRLSGPERVIAAWALTPVLANAFYWHHGILMGPRMLNEVTPAWILFTLVAIAGLYRSFPARFPAASGTFAPRIGLAALVSASLLFGWIYLLPQTVQVYGTGFAAASRIRPPVTDSPSLVFVHGAWTSRIVARLAAHGMPFDSIETAVRQNPTCALHRFTDAYVALPRGSVPHPVPDLDFEPRASDLPPRIETVEGNYFRALPGEVLSGDCLHEARADLHGIIDVSPFIWQGDLPGLETRGAMYVRDMGPVMNARLIESMPNREPVAFIRREPDADPELVPYDEAMALLWAGAPPAPGPSARPGAQHPGDETEDRGSP